LNAKSLTKLEVRHWPISTFLRPNWKTYLHQQNWQKIFSYAEWDSNRNPLMSVAAARPYELPSNALWKNALLHLFLLI